MQGSLRQRSTGSWELRVFIGVDPTTKQRRYRPMTVRGSRADAERELAAMVAAAQAVRAVGVRSTVGELLEAWFAVASTGWAPTTTRQTRSVLNRYLHPHLGHLAVGDVTPAVIDATYATLRRCGGMNGRPLAPGTLTRVHVVLRAAFSQAMRWGWIWDNPAERAHRIVHTTPELRPPTPAELNILLDHVAERDPQLHVLLVLAASTGARRAQLLGLRWHNVDLGARRVSFSAGWVEGPDGPVLTATKTKRRHVVDLDAATVDVLVDLAAERGCDAMADAFVFNDDCGVTAWKPNRVTKAFLRHRRAAGLRPFRLHDLRHFMATEMLHAGDPLVTVSRRLDHRRVSTTLDQYAHAVPGGDAQTAATLARIMHTSAWQRSGERRRAVSLRVHRSRGRRGCSASVLSRVVVGWARELGLTCPGRGTRGRRVHDPGSLCRYSGPQGVMASRSDRHRVVSSSSFTWVSARNLNSFITPRTLRFAVLAHRHGSISASAGSARLRGTPWPASAPSAWTRTGQATSRPGRRG